MLRVENYERGLERRYSNVCASKKQKMSSTMWRARSCVVTSFQHLRLHVAFFFLLVPQFPVLNLRRWGAQDASERLRRRIRLVPLAFYQKSKNSEEHVLGIRVTTLPLWSLLGRPLGWAPRGPPLWGAQTPRNCPGALGQIRDRVCGHVLAAEDNPPGVPGRDALIER